MSKKQWEEGMAKSQPYGQKPDNKAYAGGKLANDNGALKIAVTVDCLEHFVRLFFRRR